MAFIGIRLELAVARLFRHLEVPGDRVAENEQHITILCFEDNWPISEIGKAMEAAFSVLNEQEPFHVKVDKVSCFPKREDKPCPIIGKVKSKELEELNGKLKKAFDKAKVDYLKTFKDFIPHITLAYADEEIKQMSIEPVEFVVSEVVLWGGDTSDDRIFITFPLKASEKKKHSYLTQKAEIFHKLSKRDESAVFKQSVERRKTER